MNILGVAGEDVTTYNTHVHDSCGGFYSLRAIFVHLLRRTKISREHVGKAEWAIYPAV